ncbi:MAG: DUF881 domain-containing protein [Candidatus Nanopelagicales bacterium]
MTEPPDGPGRPPAGEARAAVQRLAFRPARPHLVIGLLFLVLGLLVTVALLRPDGDEPWRNARTEDLVQILDDLGARQGRLDAEAARLAQLQEDLERGSTVEALAESRRTLEGLQVLTGTTAVYGPGITITITDPDGAVDSVVLLDAVQELRDAGAEAIQVGSTRVVVDTWFGDGPQGIVVDGQPVATPIRVLAIGDGEGLAAAMSIPGGVADSVRTRGAEFEVSVDDSVSISVTVPEPAG